MAFRHRCDVSDLREGLGDVSIILVEDVVQAIGDLVIERIVPPVPNRGWVSAGSDARSPL